MVRVFDIPVFQFQRRQRVLFARGILAAIFLCIAACDPFAPAQRKWTEDVDLGDGRVIQVARAAEFRESNSWSGDAYIAEETKATIAFTGELASLPTWSEPLRALVMYQDRETQEWTIVATTTSCPIWRARGKPIPIYWEFRLASSGWHETELSKASLGRPVNLFHRYQSKLKTRHITIDERVRQQTSTTNVRFRKIVSEEKIHCM